MKVYIRTIWKEDGYWSIEDEKERVKDMLNGLNFYVLHGIGDSLEVHVIKDK